ncbi:MAG: MFS transporter [Deinococcus sp.]|nr:MFS transporter [Deinococcus sp.]
MGELHTLDLIIALVVVFDVLTGHRLSRRQLNLAEQMPEPQDREMMRQRAERGRVMLMYVSPLLLVAFYLLWLRPATV